MDQPALESTPGSLPVWDLYQKLIEQKRKLLRRLCEPLLLLQALRRAPESLKSIDDVEPSSRSIEGLRRSFVDGNAYLSAFERYSDCVTAAALETTPQGPMLWLAANDGIRSTTIEFLRKVLAELHTVAREDHPQARNIMAERITPGLLRGVITFSMPRLRKYVNNIRNINVRSCVSLMRDQVDGLATPCRPSSDSLMVLIGTNTGAQTLESCDWLETTFLAKDGASHRSQNVRRLVLDCYVQRKRLLFERLDLFACQGGPHVFDFGRLCLLLCKLGKHVTITRKVVEASVYLRDDFREPVRLAVLRSAPERAFPLTAKEGTVEGILGRAFSSKAEMNEFKVRLRSLWNSDEIEAILSKERPNKTRVHAELLVADHFYRNNLQFLGGPDRYVGCSKPMCYLYDAYLRHHPAGFAVPRSHQKIYAAWRCPDVLEDGPKAYHLHRYKRSNSSS